MAYNTVAIRKDTEGKPIPQYYNPIADAFEALLGRNGANRVELYDAAGNPVDIVTLLTDIVTKLGNVDIKTSALPTGAATSAKQDTIISWIDEIEALLKAIRDTAGIKKITDPLPAGTNTLGGVKVVGNDSVLQGNITLTGAAQQLAANQLAKVVTIQANPANQGYTYVGKSDVSDMVHMAVLSPGSSMTFYVSNLNLLYVRGSATDKVCFGGEA